MSSLYSCLQIDVESSLTNGFVSPSVLGILSTGRGFEVPPSDSTYLAKVWGMNQISKDSFDSHNVTLLWCGLKSCTHAHTQHDIRTRCTKIKQGTNHRMILPL